MKMGVKILIIQYYYLEYVFLILMSWFKGLIARQLLSDESFQPINKKAEDYRKSTQISIDFFQQITKSLQNYATTCERNNSEFGKSATAYYHQLQHLFESITKETKLLVNNSNGSFKELTSLCNTIFLDFSNFLLNFQQMVRNYQSSEQILLQLSKKYFRTHKTMMLSLQAYKSSFTDVNLIYNIEQKTKRYAQCQNSYKAITQQYTNIVEKTEKLGARKLEIIKCYDKVEQEFWKVLKVIGSKIISETKNFVNYFCLSQKKIITILAQGKYELEQKQLTSFFSLISNEEQNIEIFDGVIEIKSNLPLIFVFHERIKEEYILNYNVELMNLMKIVLEKIQQRKAENKNAFQLFNNYFKILNKTYQTGIKEIINFFDKIKKKMSETFGNKIVSFLKSINSILELSIGINEKLIKRITPKLQSIINGIEEDNKLLKLFDQEFKNGVEKFIGKKQLKKIKEEEFSQELMDVNIRLFRKQIAQKSEFFIHLIKGFDQKMIENYKKVKKNYNDVINDLESSMNQFFSLCCEYQEIYFGVDEFVNNFKKYESDINKVIEKDKSFFEEINFGVLRKESGQLTFDGQFFKVQDFKKLKKPIEIEPNQPKEVTIKTEEGEPIEGKSNHSIKELGAQKKEDSLRSSTNYEGKQEKYLQFLLTKISFIDGQALIKTFACALANKIILQGRIYITNQRICFHSKFNSGNVFFGGTFIQIPKKDIKKIEKRTNAIFFNNSISVTTVNGQVFLTSFFSRDQAYDLICKTFQISFDDEVYVQEEKDGKPSFLMELAEQEDDLKNENVPERQNKVKEMLQNFEYKEVAKVQFKKAGLNAIKILKLFYGDEQIFLNRRNYTSYFFYLKELLGHKQVQISQWEPKFSSILNLGNIKNNSELKATRKITAMVPLSNSGVPFMPKIAKSLQGYELYLISKHKWIIEGTIETTGAPYTDTFKVQLRTLAESTDQGDCKISISLFVNFIKNTMMKKIIETKSVEETTAACKIQLQEIKKYFVSMEKSKKTISKGKIQENLEQIQTQLQNSREKNEKLQEQVEKLKNTSRLKDKIILGAIILNLILILSLIG